MTQACPHCGTGSVRIDPLFVEPSACKSGIAATYKQQVLISKDVFVRLAAAGVKSLRQATDKKHNLVDFWSLEPEFVLPRWLDDSVGFERSQIQPPCSYCQRDGYYDRVKCRLELHYKALPSSDICATWEHFGSSRLLAPFEMSLFASPRLIVSNRIRDILGEYKGVDFSEVKINGPTDRCT